MSDFSRNDLHGHLGELRVRLIRVFLIMFAAIGLCFVFAQPIFGFLVRPLAEAMGEGGTNRLIYTGLTEAFFTYMKVAFFAGAFLSFPVLLAELWRFIAPGLYRRERRAILPFLVATPLLFFAGGAMVYYVVLPLAWPFFLSFQSGADVTALPVQLEARIGEYLDLVMTLIFAFGLCFQMPVLFALLGRAGIVKAKTLAAGRKYAVVAIFVCAAFLTPPDVISQILLALPMLALFELSLFIVGREEEDRHKEKDGQAGRQESKEEQTKSS